MSELAFNITGDAFDVPELVAGWRVKRLKPRGAPELVYGSDGFPLTVPIDCDMEGLRHPAAREHLLQGAQVRHAPRDVQSVGTTSIVQGVQETSSYFETSSSLKCRASSLTCGGCRMVSWLPLMGRTSSSSTKRDQPRSGDEALNRGRVCARIRVSFPG